VQGTADGLLLKNGGRSGGGVVLDDFLVHGDSLRNNRCKSRR
jgi:hypothetical protein